jgi:BirA family transcriptional regulator, biotin operon repressor / biotin---[acetyl-CoA-carboxylase] ligase
VSGAAADAGDALSGRALGTPRLHLRRTGSTNDRARELALAGAPHGTLVTASEQTAGRGRGGRSWSAPAGSSLLMSMLLRWPDEAKPPTLLPLAAAVAICDVAGEETRIKWPNDVVVEQDGSLAKLAGILVEARPQERWAILGIGLNVAVDLDALPAELRPGAGRAAATMGLPASELEPVLARLLAALARRLAEPPAETLAAWRVRDALRGREIAWAGGRGRAEGVDGSGRLVVALADGGRTALSAGEVHLEALGAADSPRDPARPDAQPPDQPRPTG